MLSVWFVRQMLGQEAGSNLGDLESLGAVHVVCTAVVPAPSPALPAGEALGVLSDCPVVSAAAEGLKARSVYNRFNEALAEASCGVIVRSAGSQSGSARDGGDRGGNSRVRDTEKPVVDTRTIQCYGCHQKGHFRTRCPLNRARPT